MPHPFVTFVNEKHIHSFPQIEFCDDLIEAIAEKKNILITPNVLELLYQNEYDLEDPEEILMATGEFLNLLNKNKIPFQMIAPSYKNIRDYKDLLRKETLCIEITANHLSFAISYMKNPDLMSEYEYFLRIRAEFEEEVLNKKIKSMKEILTKFKQQQEITNSLMNEIEKLFSELCEIQESNDE